MIFLKYHHLPLYHLTAKAILGIVVSFPIHFSWFFFPLVEHDGKIYVFGGFAPLDETHYNDLFCYNPGITLKSCGM